MPRTWTVKILGKEIGIKMNKDDAKNFQYYTLDKVTRIQQYQREISGTIMPDGTTKDEHIWGTMQLFGNAGTLSPEGMKEREELVASLPAVIDATNADEVKAICNAFYEKYLTIKDNRKTLAEETERIAQSNKFNEEHAAKQRAEAEKLSIERAELRKQYPYLREVFNSGKRDYVVASANIKTQLQREFPGQQFSVTSDHYSIRVAWVDGPTTKEVQVFTDPYVSAHFDGMTDSTSHFETAWHMFGDSDYVSCSRQMSDERREALEIEVGSNEAHSTFHDRSYYVKPEPGTYTEAPAATSASGITIRKNIAQGGIEIVFPAKPERSTIDKLKGMGYRWSFRNKVWYKKYSEYSFNEAQNTFASAQ